MGFDLNAVLNFLKPSNRTIHNKRANTEPTLIDELENCLNDTKTSMIYHTVENVAKYTLWNGLLNQYGTLGTKRDTIRKMNKKDKNGRLIKDSNGQNIKVEYYDERFKRGTLLSIDYGLSNIGKEFAFTHTGIVLEDHPGFVVVVPLTSKKEAGLSNLSDEIKKAVILAEKKEYDFLEEDSYVLVHHIRSVSKNRITMVIEDGSFNKKPIMIQIEEIIYKKLVPYTKRINNEMIKKLQDENAELRNLIKHLENAN